MMRALIQSDLMKVKKMVWLMMVAFPAGLIGLQAVNYSLRLDHLLGLHDDYWYFLLENVHIFWPTVLVLTLTLIVSLFASVEHETHTWTTLFSLPVNNGKIYLSKLAIILTVLIGSSVLFVIFSLILGLALGFGSDLPLMAASQMSLYTYIAVLPFVFLQFWLSMGFTNQGVALTTGIANAVFIMYAVDLPTWLPWRWPLLMDGITSGAPDIFYGLGTGAALMVITLIHLTRKDVAA
ncbi:ABC transporter permease [Salipaludibacillus daqingensis]|uniref:ABC transporter permease n=1 Tax=Salipaludibacillus daqingensis TaxID=3041001 RepID=UPI002473C901|nr:ABC transporter permease [Salipaludibacillus daqingensis]